MLILASASPRRRKLLAEAGYHFEVDPSGIEEAEPGGTTDVRRYSAELAFRKAYTVSLRRGSGLILAADTACSVDGQILNKPVDRSDAERMIRAQEGRHVEVVTALVLYRAERHEWVGAIESAVVHVRPLIGSERSAYLDTGLWHGKAGGYGVQDDDPFVTVVSGTWSNVVGLPLERLSELFSRYPHVTDP
jgi:septum formation protein